MKFNRLTVENFVFGNFPEAEYVSGSKEELHFNTPFDTDKKKRLYVSTDTGKWFDQKAQRGGNNFEYFVAEYLEIPVGEAIKVLLQEYSDDNYIQPEQDEKVEEKKKSTTQVLEMPKGVKFFDSDELGFVGLQAKRYLEDRKISLSGLGYFSDIKSEYYKRIFVPFYENGELVYFIARSIIADDPMRYKNPIEINAGDYVFNIDNLREDVFIFEGVFDALSLDFPQVGTAMLSSFIKDEQAKKIVQKNPRNIILVPDKDKKTKTRATILGNLIKTKNKLLEHKRYKQNFNFFIYNIPEGYKDFNDYKKETGNGIIHLHECEVFNEMEILMEIASLKY
jgi:hypothetical protein